MENQTPIKLLASELKKFKQEWCNRWMAAWRIQRKWRKHISSLDEEKEDYIRQVERNYCHQLELLFFCMNCWEMRGQERAYIPKYLFMIPKMRELILEISVKEHEVEFSITSGSDSIYWEKYINHYVATRRLINISCFRDIGASGPYSPKIIFISRPSSSKRRIENEQRLIEFLRPHIPQMEVYTFDDESSAVDQAKLFSQCRVLIGLHGAGLANLLWMVGGLCGNGHIYEITPKGHYYHNYREKAQFRGLAHRYIEIEKFEKSEDSVVYPRDSILHISGEEMNSMLDAMIRDKVANKIEDVRFTDKTDEAIWRRISIIPFDNTWTKELKE